MRATLGIAISSAHPRCDRWSRPHRGDGHARVGSDAGGSEHAEPHAIGLLQRRVLPQRHPHHVRSGIQPMFRTAEGSELAATVISPSVAFQADGDQPHTGEVSSVVVKGRAYEINELHDLLGAAVPINAIGTPRVASRATPGRAGRQVQRVAAFLGAHRPARGRRVRRGRVGRGNNWRITTKPAPAL